jgi:hypothetical protein
MVNSLDWSPDHPHDVIPLGVQAITGTVFEIALSPSTVASEPYVML